MKEYQWDLIHEQAGFAPRDGAGALVFKNQMWLLGGWNPNDKFHFPKICNSEVWSSENGRDWKLVNRQAPWEGRHTAGYVVFQDKMWIVGGDANQKHYQNDTWNSSDGKHWEKVSAEAPWAPRVLAYVVAFNDKLWLMGGQTVPQIAPEEERFYSDVWNSEDGVTWKRVAENLPWGVRGMIGGSAVFNGRMWILGGGTYSTPNRPNRDFHNDVWSSPDGVRWECSTSDAPWVPRQYHDVAVFDDRLWVMEGVGSDMVNRKDVWYSKDGVEWTELPDTPWLPRHAASVFVFNEALWMVAGNNMTPDVWKLVRRLPKS